MVNKIQKMFSSPRGASAYETVVSFMGKHGIDEKIKKGVLLGLSGGADSVFLALLLFEYKRLSGIDFPVVAVHVNHGIRGGEADRDERFSKRLSEQLGFEFVSEIFDVPGSSQEIGKGIEETARIVRYRCFCGLSHLERIQSRSRSARCQNR